MENMEDVMPEAVMHFLNNVQPDLDVFANDNCDTFRDVNVDADQEQDLEHFRLFQEYLKIFEEGMQNFLLGNDLSLQDFVAMCKKAEIDLRKGKDNPDVEFLDLLSFIDNYSEFLLFMRDTWRLKHVGQGAVTLQCAPLPETTPAPAKELKRIMPEAVTFLLHAVQPILDQWVEKNCIKFLVGGEDDKDEEHSLEHFELYKRYTAIFEKHMSAFLTSRDICLEDFVARCKEAKAEKDAGHVTTAASFLSVVALMDDFSAFVEYMQEEAAASV